MSYVFQPASPRPAFVSIPFGASHFNFPTHHLRLWNLFEHLLSGKRRLAPFFMIPASSVLFPASAGLRKLPDFPQTVLLPERNSFSRSLPGAGAAPRSQRRDCFKVLGATLHGLFTSRESLPPESRAVAALGDRMLSVVPPTGTTPVPFIILVGPFFHGDRSRFLTRPCGQ